MFQQQNWRYLENTERQSKIGKDLIDDIYIKIKRQIIDTQHDTQINIEKYFPDVISKDYILIVDHSLSK